MTTLSDAEIIAEAKHRLGAKDSGISNTAIRRDTLRALIALAEQPKLPEEPTPEMLKAIRQGSIVPFNEDWSKASYRALRDQLAPKPKGWRIDWTYKHGDTGGTNEMTREGVDSVVHDCITRGVRFTVVPL